MSLVDMFYMRNILLSLRPQYVYYKHTNIDNWQIFVMTSLIDVKTCTESESISDL